MPAFVKTTADEARWAKAKDAAKAAGADDVYAFANWWFHHNGEKKESIEALRHQLAASIVEQLVGEATASGMIASRPTGMGSSATVVSGGAPLHTSDEVEETPDFDRAQMQIRKVASTRELKFSDDNHVREQFDAGDEFFDAGCPSCGGERKFLGSLGSRQHFRCIGCGMDSSHDTAPTPANTPMKSSRKAGITTMFRAPQKRVQHEEEEPPWSTANSMANLLYGDEFRRSMVRRAGVQAANAALDPASHVDDVIQKATRAASAGRSYQKSTGKLGRDEATARAVLHDLDEGV